MREEFFALICVVCHIGWPNGKGNTHKEKISKGLQVINIYIGYRLYL